MITNLWPEQAVFPCPHAGFHSSFQQPEGPDKTEFRRHASHAGATALVFFSGRTTIKWLGLLKPGYRHCFVVFQWHDQWIIVEPLSHVLEVGILPGLTTDQVMAFYRQAGMTALETKIRPTASMTFPWRPYTCVEVIKRILGIHKSSVLTPYGLYKFLKYENKP